MQGWRETSGWPRNSKQLQKEEGTNTARLPCYWCRGKFVPLELIAWSNFYSQATSLTRKGLCSQNRIFPFTFDLENTNFFPISHPPLKQQQLILFRCQNEQEMGDLPTGLTVPILQLHKCCPVWAHTAKTQSRLVFYTEVEAGSVHGNQEIHSLLPGRVLEKQNLVDKAWVLCNSKEMAFKAVCICTDFLSAHHQDVWAVWTASQLSGPFGNWFLPSDLHCSRNEDFKTLCV